MIGCCYELVSLFRDMTTCLVNSHITEKNYENIT